MSSSLPMKIKTVFKKDIRRLDLSEVSFAELRASVAAAYNIPSRSFELFFKDDEEDVCKISGDVELTEALALAASLNAKVLKVYVSEQGTADSLDTSDDVEVEDVTYAANIDVPPQRLSDKEGNSAPPAADGAEESKKPSADEIKRLGLDFVRNQEVQAALLPFANTVLTLLEGDEDVETLLEIALASHEVIGSHPVVARLRPFLPMVLPALSQKVEALRARPQLLQMARGMLPFVLPMLLQHPLLHVPHGADSSVPSDADVLSALPPQIAAELQSIIGGSCASSACGDGACGGPCGDASCDTKDSHGADADQPIAEDAHSNVVCDGCGTAPIVGDRYKCTVCNDFDLCSTCESKNIHPASHPLIKMRVPFGSAAHLKDVQHAGVACDGCGMHPIVGPRYKCSVCNDYDLCEACENKNFHPPSHPLVKMKLPKRGPGMGLGMGMGTGAPLHRHRMFGGAGHHGRRGGGHCGRGGLFKALFGGRGGHGRPGCGARRQCHRRPVQEPNAIYIKDANLEDRTEVEAGQSLIKTWIMKNGGEKPWPEGVKLIFVRGDREFSAEEEFPVPAAAPGEEVEVSAELRAPANASQARLTAYYRLGDAERNLFGPKVWVDLIVKPSPDAPPSGASASQAGAPVTDQKTKEEPSAKAPAAPTVAAADPALKEKYGLQLQVLASMGFRDEIVVLSLLEKHGGDVQATYKDLVKMLL